MRIIAVEKRYKNVIKSENMKTNGYTVYLTQYEGPGGYIFGTRCPNDNATCVNE